MHCQKCHKNFASIRYAEVVDGEVIEQHLCKECLNQKQSAHQSGFEFTTPSPFIRKDKETSSTKTSHYKIMSCSTCNTTLQSILDTKQVGCCQCYDTFQTHIDTLLEEIHQSQTHTGKVPRQDNIRAKTRSDLQTKRALLKTSLSAERYEEAATLRDEIKLLQAGLNTALQESE